jgi:hypothetical protein
LIEKSIVNDVSISQKKCKIPHKNQNFEFFNLHHPKLHTRKIQIPTQITRFHQNQTKNNQKRQAPNPEPINTSNKPWRKQGIDCTTSKLSLNPKNHTKNRRGLEVGGRAPNKILLHARSSSTKNNEAIMIIKRRADC